MTPRVAADASRPAATPDRTLYMIGNAHLDPVWLWPWQEGYQEARATFWSAIHRMDEYPDFVFTCDQVVLLSWVEEGDPELFERIRQRVAEGRWVNVGGWWVEPDCNMPMGESFVRQGLYGQRYLESAVRPRRDRRDERRPVRAQRDAPADPPRAGHGLATCSCVPGRTRAISGTTLFQWESPDGCRVLAYRIPYEYGSSARSVDGQIEKSLGQLDRGLGDAMVFYGVGNHGGGPTMANIDSIHRYDAMGSFGSDADGFPARLLRRRARARPGRLADRPGPPDDLQHHAAGLLLGALGHQGVAAPSAVRGADRGAVGGRRRDAPTASRYPREPSSSARGSRCCSTSSTTSSPGSAIEPSYEDARDQLGEAVVDREAHHRRARTTSIARQVDIPFEDGTQPVLVFNQHPWPVSRPTSPLQFGAQPQGLHMVDADGCTGAHAAQRRSSRRRMTRTAARSCSARRCRRSATASTACARAARGAATGPRSGDRASDRERRSCASTSTPPRAGISSLLDKRTGVDVVAGTDPTDAHAGAARTRPTPGAPGGLLRRARGADAAATASSCASRGRCARGCGSSAAGVARRWSRSCSLGRRRATCCASTSTLDWREHAHLLKLRFPTALADAAGDVRDPVRPHRAPGRRRRGAGAALGRPDRARSAVVRRADRDHDQQARATTSRPATGRASASPRCGARSTRGTTPSCSTRTGLPLPGPGRAALRSSSSCRTTGTARGDPVRRATLLGSPVRAMLESFHGGALPPSDSFASDGGRRVLVTALKGSEEPVDGARRRRPDRAGRGDLRSARTATGDRAADRRAGRSTPTSVRSRSATFRVPRDAGAAVAEVDLVERPLAG